MLLVGRRVIVGNTVARQTIQHLKVADCGDAFGLKKTGSCTSDNGHAVRGESASPMGAQPTEGAGGRGCNFHVEEVEIGYYPSLFTAEKMGAFSTNDPIIYSWSRRFGLYIPCKTQRRPLN